MGMRVVQVRPGGRLATAKIAGLAAAGAAAAALGGASPAAAQAGHTLALSGPAAGATGEPVVIQATGVVPSDVLLNRYLNVYALPRTVASACPASYQGALQIKDNTGASGGETVALSVPAEGSFSIPVAWTPRTAGSVLLCGYVHEGVETMAVAQHGFTVSGGAPSGGGGGSAGSVPANTAAPKLRRVGSRLVCSRGRWSGGPTSFSYGWTVDGRRSSRATGRRLRITKALDGARVRCSVTATNAAGSATKRSRAVTVR